ncbi:VCBS domain-containing protein [Sphingomicrobium flavum]|uniref:VCBS domain-containing protein n=1 Tax=Sphingomicrobium flavum TaxID=1229164 RepID=UPI0021ADC0A4|nr:Ig-like domain-containing protein [Sphingomicrobium flavum]
MGGSFTYEYTLTDNTLDHDASGEDNVFDNIAVNVTDEDGDSADAELNIEIVDDVPDARDDDDSLTEGDPTATDGNVITGAGTAGGLGGVGADTQGADGAQVSSAGVYVGTYGTLTLNADGSYDYVLSDFGIDTMNALSDGESVQDSFDYTLTDGDLDSDSATLTITINGENDVVTLGRLDASLAELSVDEDDLSPDGSDQTDSLIDSDIFTFTSPDGLDDVTVGGVDVVVDGVYVGGTVIIAGAYGTLTITGFTPVTDNAGNIVSGSFSYSYELSANTLDHDALGEDAVFDNFAVVATDDDGDIANGSLDVQVVDDVPEANDDEDSLSEGGPTSTDGNVITGAGTDSGALGADVEGADGAVVSTPGVYVGTYGTLTLGADGGYTYVLNELGIATMNALTEGESVSEDFGYTLTDGDNDSDDATLTIILNGENDIVTINGLDGQGAEEVVDEDDLPDGSSPNPAALIQDGNFSFDSPDGVDDVTIGGTLVVINGVYQGDQTITTQYGELTITGFTPVTDAGGTIIGGTFTYDYELTDNTLDHDAAGQDNVFDDITVIVTDEDGDSDTAELNIQVIDDVPVAEDDFDSDIVEDGPTSTGGNVITGAGTDGGLDGAGSDTLGADGAAVSNPGVYIGAYGTLTLGADGGYTYVMSADGIAALELLSDGETLEDSFDYTLTDGDLDSDPATLTIIMNGQNDIVVINGLDVNGGEATIDEDDLATSTGNPTAGGSDDTPESTTTAPLQFDFESPDGVDDVVIGGTTVIQNGAFLGAVTIDSSIGTLSITDFTPDLSPDGTVIGGTFTYTYTLNDNTAHPNADGQNSIQDSFAVSVTDEDGDFANASLDINVVDDVPTAVDDGSLLAPIDIPEDTATQIDVFSNDEQGADGVVTGDITLVTDATNGTVVYDGNGFFTYTPDDGYAGPDQFEYQIVDADGDVSTAIVYLNVADDSLPIIDDADNVALDEDGFGDANSDDGQTDPLEVTGNGLLVNSGTVDVNFGADVPANEADALAQFSWVDTAALDNFLDANGTDVTFAIVGGDLVGSAGGQDVIRIELDGAAINGTVVTYTYKVTLLQELDHQDGDDSEALATLAGVTFEISDPDTSFTTQGNFDVTIQDDVPETDVAGDTSVVEGETASGTWSTVVGADNPGATVVIFNGAEYAIDEAIATGNGTLTVNADGTWDFVSNDNLDNDLAQGISFTVRTTDGDGDVAEDTQDVTITDGAGPLGGDTLSLTVDDEALNDDGNTPGSTAEVDDGQLSFTAGSDDLTSFAFDTDLSNLDSSLTWVRVNDTTITGSDGGRLVVTLTLSAPASIAAGASGDVTVTATLNDEYNDHPLFTQDDTFDLGDVTVVAADQDGDSATGTVSLFVSDDVPTADVTGDVTVIEGQTASGSWNVSMGADQPGSVVVIFGGAEYAIDEAIATGNGTLTVNADGTWDFVADDNLDNNVAQAISFTIQATDADDDVASDVQNVTITDGAGPLGGDTLSLTVDDEALNSGGSDPASSAEVDDGQLSFTAGSDDLTGFVFDTDLTNLDSSLTWSRVNDTTITGSDGGRLVVTLTLSAPASIAAGATGDVTVTATLNDEYNDHPLFTQDDTFDLGDVAVVASDQDGDSATGTVSLFVSDDVPTAVDDGSSAPGAGLPIPEDTATLIDVFDNDVPGADGVQSGAIALNTGPANGTAVYIGDGMFLYTPNDGFEGDDSFTYIIRDGDNDESVATVYVTVAEDSTPFVGPAGNMLVDEDGVAGSNVDSNPLQTNPAETTSTGLSTDSSSVTVNFDNDVPDDLDASIIFINAADLNDQLTQNDVDIVFSIDADGNIEGRLDNVANTLVLEISLTGATDNLDGTVTYGYDVELFGPVDQADDESENTITLTGVQFQVTDSDLDTATGSFNVSITDDVPSMGEIEDGSSTNDPDDIANPPFVGDLNFTDSLDGVESVTITANVTGITSDGKSLITEQSGNVLTAFADNDGSGTINAGDTAVFTITVDPDAGTSGEYEFDLLAPLDGEVVPVPIGGSNKAAGGPVDSVILFDGNPKSGPVDDLAVVSGFFWNPSAADLAAWKAGADADTLSTGLTNGQVNGSLGGWGVANNNFTTGELLNWDFGPEALDNPDGPGGFSPPGGTTLPTVTTAEFGFANFADNEVIHYVVHFTDGSPSVGGSFNIGSLADGQGNDKVWFFDGQGKAIADIEMYSQASGSGKVYLSSVGTTAEDIDIDIPVTITIEDNDGDTVSDDFTINVAQIGSPFLASFGKQALNADNDNLLMQQQSFSQSLMMGTAIAMGFGLQSQGSLEGVEMTYSVDPMMMQLPTVPMLDGPMLSLDDYGIGGLDLTAMSADLGGDNAVTTMVAGREAIDLGGIEGAGFAPAAIEQVAFDAGTTMPMPANDGFAAFGGGDIAMPGAEGMLMLAQAGRVPAEGLGDILADALDGGESNPLDAALASLGGDNGMVMEMADFANVAMWDNGVFGSFTPAAPEVMVMDAMVLHHDAVTPAVNG